MLFFDKLPRIAQGILLIIAGLIILLDTLGYATQIIHTTVIIAAIGLIIWGFIVADLIGKLAKLFKKDQSNPPL